MRDGVKGMGFGGVLAACGGCLGLWCAARGVFLELLFFLVACVF